MSTRILLLHDEHAPTDWLLAHVQKSEMAARVFSLKEPGRAPDPVDYAALIALSSPIYDKESPSSRQLRTLVLSAMEQDLPCLLIGLGVQILTAVLGGSEYPGHVVFRFGECDLTEDGKVDPLYRHIGRAHMVLLWHRHSYDLPRGTVCLATNPHMPILAVRLGKSIYGLQYHLGFAPALLSRWLTEAQSAQRKGESLEVPDQALITLMQPGWFGFYERESAQLLSNFLSIVRERF